MWSQDSIAGPHTSVFAWSQAQAYSCQMQYNILQKGRLVPFAGRFYILQVKINSVGIYSLLSNILLVSVVIFKMLSMQIKKKMAQFTQYTKLISFPGRIEVEKTHFLKKTLYLIKPLCARVEHAFALRKSLVPYSL